MCHTQAGNESGVGQQVLEKFALGGGGPVTMRADAAKNTDANGYFPGAGVMMSGRRAFLGVQTASYLEH